MNRINLIEFGFDFENFSESLQKIAASNEKRPDSLTIDLTGCLVDYQDTPQFLSELFEILDFLNQIDNKELILIRDQYSSDQDTLSDIFISPLTQCEKTKFSLPNLLIFCKENKLTITLKEKTEDGTETSTWSSTDDQRQ